MTTASITLSRVTKTYGRVARSTPVLDDLTLEIPSGEFVSVMGPSGSGKTTLLNLIAGLDAPDTGSIAVAGRDLGRLADHELADLRLRTIGFVFQAYNLLPALTVADNVAWPLEVAGFSRREVRARTAHALSRAGVTGRDDRHPGDCSGGEQQRIAIARAIAGEPRILLADEPTGNLDSHTGQDILDLLRALNRADGVTVVMVTHNVFAATYGDRTLEIQDGRVMRDIRTPPTAALTSVRPGRQA